MGLVHLSGARRLRWPSSFVTMSYSEHRERARPQLPKGRGGNRRGDGEVGATGVTVSVRAALIKEHPRTNGGERALLGTCQAG